MAEISQSSGSSSRARIRGKKHSTRIDMTPMVDLAFLLLTFFILTTTLNKLEVMEIVTHQKTEETMPVTEKRVLTLLVDEISSMQDSTYQIQLADNIPVRIAETAKLELAAFYLPSVNAPYLIPSSNDAAIGDTSQLFSKIVYDGKTSLSNEGVVVYRTDSTMVYELLHFNAARIMARTSGSAILNKAGQVVANSYAGFTVPNQQVKGEMEKMFPLLKKIPTRDGKTYGAGVPISLIEKSLLEAIGTQSQ